MSSPHVSVPCPLDASTSTVADASAASIGAESSLRAPGSLTLLIAAILGVTSAAAASPPPCPPYVELPCVPPDPDGEEGGVPPTFVCQPGPGGWVRPPISHAGSPAQPIDDRLEFTMGLTRWHRHRTAESRPSFASCMTMLSGQSIFAGTGSQATSIAASFQTQLREYWEGVGPASPRLVSLAATGFAGMSISVTCSPQMGCVSTAASTVAGSCASLGNASALLEPRAIDASVRYDASSSRLEFEGNIGASVEDSNLSMIGSMSRDARWSLQGTGAASGGASYAVRPDRTYCAFTNRPITRRGSAGMSTSVAATVNAGSAAATAIAVAGFEVN